MRKVLPATALLGLLLASPALAQAPIKLEINGHGGLYVAASNAVGADDPANDLGVDVKQASAAAFGGRLTLWVTEMFGIEGSFTYALADIKADVDGESLCDQGLVCDANLWAGSVKGLYRFVPMPASIWSIHLGGGAALIGRGGDAFDGVDGTTDVGGVLNVGATFDVTPQVGIRLDVEDYLYSAKFDVDGVESESKFQNDLMFTGGISIMLGGGM